MQSNDGPLQLPLDVHTLIYRRTKTDLTFGMCTYSIHEVNGANPFVSSSKAQGLTAPQPVATSLRKSTLLFNSDANLYFILKDYYLDGSNPREYGPLVSILHS